MNNYNFLTNEITDKLRAYQELLVNYQKKTNLISNNTVDDIWERHILDSAQLYPILKTYFKDNGIRIGDFGTGAGLPGIVLALIDNSNSYHLIESNGKKIDFLKEVEKELGIPNIEIMHSRIEDLIARKERFNIITSRAMAKLDLLYSYSREMLSKDGICLFLKGKSYQDEVKILLKRYKNLSNKISYYDSITNSESKIVEIKI